MWEHVRRVLIVLTDKVGRIVLEKLAYLYRALARVIPRLIPARHECDYWETAGA